VPGAGGTERVRAHLEASYGIRVTSLSELDAGVFRVGRADGPDWVARVFPAGRPVPAAQGDADTLRFVAEHGFRSERTAAPEPVSVLDGRGVLVTEYVDGVPRQQRREMIRRLGGFWSLGVMLGELHTLPGQDGIARDGGAWHHLAEGHPREEIATALLVLDHATDGLTGADRRSAEAFRKEIEGFDSGDGLPGALTHPDFVLDNVVPSAKRGLVVVDWTGAGQGPRMWSLAFLLLAAGGRGLDRVDRTVTGYLTQVRPEPEELDRLGGMIRVRPAMFSVWAIGQGRNSIAEARRDVAETRELADAVAARAREAFANPTR
jgi:Ser/Thr protein kinase RdoA (MazF antagonist)